MKRVGTSAQGRFTLKTHRPWPSGQTLFLMTPPPPFVPAGGGFEWDDDFTSSTDSSFLSKASPSSEAASSSSFFSPAPATGRKPETTWTPSPNYSRFSISPASIANFSLTHLTDSDIEQGGEWGAARIHKKPSTVISKVSKTVLDALEMIEPDHDQVGSF